MQREKIIADAVKALSALDGGEIKRRSCLPSKERVRELTNKIGGLLFPYFCEEKSLSLQAEEIMERMTEQLSFALLERKNEAEKLSEEIFLIFPEIKKRLLKDALAIYEGDPAAISPSEVILTYPGFYAISVYRVAHEFYLRKIPYIPRIMTELAHERTGIDIHPGASIGESFCIDHGTGIVIGETTVIGDRVKIYQGVTLGAKSFELGEDGNPVKGVKRHPEIGNDCIIYAGATILGGETKIGDGCTVGGNVWLTHSLPAGEIIYYKR